MEFLVWTYFSQFVFVGSSINIMEVAKVNKLSLELNKMGIKHIIFTLDNVSTKTFGDSTTLKRLKDSPELKLEYTTFFRNQNRRTMIWSKFVQHQMFDCWRPTLFMGRGVPR